MRKLWASAVLLAWVATGTLAQSQDGIFLDYEAYATYVDQSIMERDFGSMIQRLGGRDEYTKEELASTERQLLGVWPRDFSDKTVFNNLDLGGGISHEGRVYWTGTYYAYFYALLHDRGDEVVVLNFLLNSSSKPIMDRF
ncbi:MAG: hypothetical protein P1U53_09635 [Sulfitobacter sp.]|nr:hypothetical protein [Sulfitobacter sp.]